MPIRLKRARRFISPVNAYGPLCAGSVRLTRHVHVEEVELLTQQRSEQPSADVGHHALRRGVEDVHPYARQRAGDDCQQNELQRNAVQASPRSCCVYPSRIGRHRVQQLAREIRQAVEGGARKDENDAAKSESRPHVSSLLPDAAPAAERTGLLLLLRLLLRRVSSGLRVEQAAALLRDTHAHVLVWHGGARHALRCERALGWLTPFARRLSLPPARYMHV